MAEVYTDPDAQAAVLGLGSSPENKQIASALMKPQGLTNMMQSEGPPDPGTGIPTGMPPTGMPPTGMPPTGGFGPSDLGTEESAERVEQEKIRVEWMIRNENKRVPWDPNVTWGDFLGRIFEKAEAENPGLGPDAVSGFVDSEIQKELIQADPNQGQTRAPEIPVLPLPGNNEQQMAAAAGNIAAPVAPPPMAPVAPPPMAPVADQQGIMAAAYGGLVGYAQGGLVGYAQGGMAQGAMSEEEFMSALNTGVSQAGIPPEQIAAIASQAGIPPEQIAAMTAKGGPMRANDNVMDTGIMQNVEPVEGTNADMTGIGSLTEISNRLVDSGEEGLVHASPGELIFDPRRLNEPDQRMLLAALETAGIDPETATVGNENNIRNQVTGLPAFWFHKWIKRKVKKVGKWIKKGAKKVGKFLKENAGTILSIAGAMTGNPLLAALGAGIGALIEGKTIKQALIGAAMSYVSVRWVGPYISDQLTSFAPSIFGKSIGSVASGAAESVGATSTSEALSAAAKEGASSLAIRQTALQAGTKVALANGSRTAIQGAVQDSLTTGALDAIQTGFVSGATDTFSQEAVNQTAQSITSKIVQDQAAGMLGKAVTTVASATLPQGMSAMGSTGAQLAARTVGDITGGAIAGAGSMYAQKKYEESQFESEEEETKALAAWNERYDYVPSAQELYQFYTTEFLPGQQVDPGLIAGTPGYGPGQQAGAQMYGPAISGLPAGGPQLMGAIPTATPMNQLAVAGPQVPGIQRGLVAQPQPGTIPVPRSEWGRALMPNSLGIMNVAGGGYINGIGGPRDDSNLARLSNGEFVMTERAVRGAGYGDRMDGAARMYNIMQGFERSAA